MVSWLFFKKKGRSNISVFSLISHEMCAASQGCHWLSPNRQCSGLFRKNLLLSVMYLSHWCYTKRKRVYLSVSRSVMSDSLRPHGLQHTRLPWSLLRLTSIESVMPSNHLILCCALLLQPSIFPSIRAFSSESALHCAAVDSEMVGQVGVGWGVKSPKWNSSE